MPLLNETAIRNNINSLELNHQLRFHIFDTIDSTNVFLKNLPNDSSKNNIIDICCSEYQTNGKGRFGRAWTSAAYENICLSIRYKINLAYSKLSAISLVTGLAIIKSLSELNIKDLKIKWPNDVYWQNQKLAGILIELLHSNKQDTAPQPLNYHHTLIFGIGINVNSDSKNQSCINIDKPWCSLFGISKDHLDRNIIIGKIINNLHNYILLFRKDGFNIFTDEWKTVDYLHGKNISIIQQSTINSGKYIGVSESGELILQNELGETIRITSGEAS
ncbi:MAG: biotin--[acetyl-CoA-carboxylase] ligase [Legionellales bacterium RIFCSPHIGHO2_12_FULL_35_11]|nr:MAG: biotin--[acetyl-CoA-carboxylase] ligase [Legionellales bacterium RIFCSPHIGHO2_12_FULL_35_11]